MNAGRWLRPLSWVVVSALVATAMPAAAQETAVASAASEVHAPVTTPGFATPEDAVLEYMAAVAGGDVERILETVAVDELSEGFRFDLMIDRFGVFQPLYSLSPADYPFYVEMNRTHQTARVLGQVRSLVFSLLSDIEIDGIPVPDVDRAWALDFIQDVDPSRLDALTLIDVQIVNDDFLDSTQYQVIAALQARTAGVDEFTERLALFSFGGDLFYVGFTLVRNGDSWKVSEQFAPAAGTNAFGSATPITADEWDELTGGS